jgi:hypothetical protein
VHRLRCKQKYCQVLTGGEIWRCLPCFDYRRIHLEMRTLFDIDNS